jgi:hypothetical protein
VRISPRVWRQYRAVVVAQLRHRREATTADRDADLRRLRDGYQRRQQASEVISSSH